MKRKEFKPNELSKKAFDIYSNSDMVFWQDIDGIYYVSDTGSSQKFQVGNICDVEEYLIGE